MRPESYDPGNAPGIRGFLQGRQRDFNEAGVLRPRKFSKEVNSYARNDHFNEAGVLRPRKCAAACQAPAPPPHFNEAGVLRPRKCGEGEPIPEREETDFNEAGVLR